MHGLPLRARGAVLLEHRAAAASVGEAREGARVRVRVPAVRDWVVDHSEPGRNLARGRRGVVPVRPVLAVRASAMICQGVIQRAKLYWFAACALGFCLPQLHFLHAREHEPSWDFDGPFNRLSVPIFGPPYIVLLLYFVCC